MSETGSPTLLVFTLGERARGRLLPAALGRCEAALARACLERALEAGREAGCLLEVSTPQALALGPDVAVHPQPGSGFGDRLARAAEGATAEGPLLVVGTDVPGLAASHLEEALRRLRRDPDTVVLGPSPDGGCYLVASARPLGGLLRQVRWCRRDTLAHLVSLLEGVGRPVSLLEPLADLDRRPDLERWLAGRLGALAGWSRHLGGLRRALASLCRPAAPHTLGQPLLRPLPIPAGRGPPAPRPFRR